MKKYFIAVITICLLATSCKDFLVKENPVAVESEFYFTDETSLQIYTNGLCRTYSPSMLDFINGDRYSDTQSWDGEYKFYTPRFEQADQTSWSWTNLRTINYYLDNMRKAQAEPEILDHYEGVGRFFRALFYIDKLKTYGAVPWYDKVIDPTDKEALYKARDARSVIAKNILADLNYAAEHCSADAKFINRATVINKYVANAVKARFCLFEGTYRIYHTNDPSTGKPWTTEEKNEGTGLYLPECVKACEVIMNSGKFGLIHTAGKEETQYREMFICADACGTCTKEWIWARDYDAGFQVQQKSYGINDYMINAQHAQYAFNRDFVMTYLKLDGTPYTDGFDLSKNEQLYVPFDQEVLNRDYRLKQTIRTPGFERANGPWAPDFLFSKTGYQPCKWITHEINDDIAAAVYTDVPMYRYAEVLLNYAEAKAELGQKTEEVWNKTIKLLRERAGVKSVFPAKADPYMVKYFLDKVTDPFILEVRRERGTELCMENVRQDDDMRWHMGDLLVRQKTGMYIAEIDKELDLNNDGKMDNIVSATKKESPGLGLLQINYNGSTLSAVEHILSDGNKGYIIPFTKYYKTYKWEEKKYVRPIPNVSVTMNDKLGQNAGW